MRHSRHERMHRTLKEDAADPPAATLAEQQRRFDEVRFEDRPPGQARGLAAV